MGTIVVVKKKDSISIAADCCNVRDTAMRTNLNISHGCVLKFKDSYIGLNASLGFQQALEDLLESWSSEQNPPLTNRRNIRLFFSRVHEVLKQRSGMYVNFQQNQEFEWTPMNALIANSSGIFKIDSSRGVYQFSKFWAMGTGESYALGAMAAVYKTMENAEEIAKAGLEAVRELEVDFDRKAEVFSVVTPAKVVSVALAADATSSKASKQVTKLPKVRRLRNHST